MLAELIAWPYTHGFVPDPPEQMIDDYEPGTRDQVMVDFMDGLISEGDYETIRTSRNRVRPQRS